MIGTRSVMRRLSGVAVGLWGTRMGPEGVQMWVRALTGALADERWRLSALATQKSTDFAFGASDAKSDVRRERGRSRQPARSALAR